MPKVKTKSKRNTRKAAPDHGDAAKQTRKSRMPVQVNVPLPNIEYLSLAGPAVQGKRSIQSRSEHQESRYQVFAGRWKKHVDRFQLKVDLEKLDGRPKKSPKNKKQAIKTVEKMREWESDPLSGYFFDRKGKPLLAVFANRIVTGPETPSQEYQSYQTGEGGCPGRTLGDLNQAGKIVRDGFPAQDLERYEQATQILHSFLHPVSHERDGRHNVHEKIINLSTGDNVDTSRIEEELGNRASFATSGGDPHCFERVGVSHIVHAWPQQGHSGNFSCSSDWTRTCSAAGAIKYYLKATEGMAQRLAAMFEVAFPEYYAKYRKAFDAGVWETDDCGPWLGRAIVWKLQVLPHRDGLDAGPAATFPMGSYSGGEMYFPDLGLKFTYGPGDVIISMAGALYHAVGDWKPEEVTNGSETTPGRISHAFFFPEESYQFLKDKPAGWAINTMWGKVPHVHGG